MNSLARIFALLLVWSTSLFSLSAQAEERIVVAGNLENPSVTHFFNALQSRISRLPGQYHSRLVNSDQRQKLNLNPNDWLICVGIKCLDKSRGFNRRKTLVVMAQQDAADRSRWSNSIPILLQDQPFERYLSLAKIIAPNSKKLLTLLSPPSTRLNRLQKAARRNDQYLLGVTVTRKNQPLRSLQQFLKRSQLIILLPEPEIIAQSNIRALMLSAFRANLPVIAFSPAYVKAGAVIGLYSSPEHYAAMTVDMMERMLQHHVSGQYAPWLYDIAVNHDAARSLGMTLPSSMKILRQLKKEQARQGY